MIISRRTALIGSLAAAGLAGRVAGQTRAPRTDETRHLAAPDPTETIDLWPGPPPGAPATLAGRDGARAEQGSGL